MRTRSFIMAVGTVSAGLSLILPGVATAESKPTAKPVIKSSAVMMPFNLEVGRNSVLVADGGLNLVGKLKKDGSLATIASNQPGAAGVATSRNGKWLAFATTVTNEQTFENTASGLNLWGPWGKRIYADIHAYEVKHNPDKKYSYGVKNPSKCVSDTLNAMQFPVSYKGLVDAHAYSVAAVRGAWVVADAGANALFTVSNSGKVRTLSVLPPHPFTFDKASAAALELPDCFIGVTYNFESVPTDVELGRDGYLYVTTLPGGPESPALGARGKLWRVNPWTGKATVVASGFLGATNLAIGKHGEFYVAEMFAGKITKISHGKRSTLAELPGVIAVETGPDGSIWAGTMGSMDPSAPPAPGTIVKIVKGKPQQQSRT
ncbi:MAG: ScyD/ScyE family protein [Micropruina sp.]|uniref:ScyD/ScyE family protein n=1 Tax=Micropruina sp. TaxID=2737536 RepID=UPI0039E37551